MGKMTDLLSLNISHNVLTGTLPTTFGTTVTGNVRDIRSIDVGYNDLTGTLPSSWTWLTDLNELSLASNLQFSGTISSNFINRRPRNVNLDLQFQLTNITGNFTELFCGVNGNTGFPILRIRNLWADCLIDDHSNDNENNGIGQNGPATSTTTTTIPCDCCTHCCNETTCCNVATNICTSNP